MERNNADGRINFGMYYINDIYKWGYEVVDTLEKQTIRRGYNYETMEDARAAGFEAAKETIHELEGERD